MILETIVVAACFYGNNEACLSSLDSYTKYTKLDIAAEKLDKKIKEKHPTLHFWGATLGIATQKKYNFRLYRNIWYTGDFSNNTDIKNVLSWKYTY